MPNLENETKQEIELIVAPTLDELNDRLPQGIVSNLGRDSSTASNNFELNAEKQVILIGSATDEDTGTGVFMGKAVDKNFDLRVGNPAGDNLDWDGSAGTLTITGSITASSGTIGGFDIGADYIRDVANSMGLASTVTGGDDVRFWAGDTFANRATADFRVTEAGAMVATSATITGGDLTASELNSNTVDSDQIVALAVTNAKINDLAVSKLTAGTISSKDIVLGITAGTGDVAVRAGKTDFTNVESGFILGLDDSDLDLAKFYIGNATTYLNWTGSTLSVKGGITIDSGSGIANLTDAGALAVEDTVTPSLANIALQGWTQTSAFSVTDLDTVAWGAGTLTTANGTNYSIGAANTGNMAARTYIYLDIAVSTIAYQTTTTATTAVGAGKILVATAVNGTDEAEFEVFSGIGGSNINASQIVASSITANEIAASTITAGKLSISQLSAIAADLGSITAGTVTGATIQTASSGARFVMNTTELSGIDDDANTIFHVVVSGANVGDVEIGGYSANKEGVLWDKSDGVLKFRQREVKLSAHFEDMTDLGATVSQDNFEAIASLTAAQGIVTNAAKADSTKNFILEFDAKLTTLGSTEGFFWGLKGSNSVASAGVNYPGVGGDAHNLTEDHAGFILAEIGGVDTLLASTANGTTQTKSSAITGITLTNYNRYRIERVSTSIYFYINGVLKATLTTNLTDDTTCIIGFLGIQSGGGESFSIKQGWSYVEAT